MRGIAVFSVIMAGCSALSGCAREPYNTSHQYLPDPLVAVGRQHIAACSEHRERGTINGHRRFYRWDAYVGDEGPRRKEACGDITIDTKTDDWSVSDAFSSDSRGWLLRASLESQDSPAWRLTVSCVSRSAELADPNEGIPSSEGLTSGRDLSVSVHGPLPEEASSAEMVLSAPDTEQIGTWTAEHVDANKQAGGADDQAGLTLSERNGAGELASWLGASEWGNPKTLEVVVKPGGGEIGFEIDSSDAAVAAAVASECGPLEYAMQ